MIIYVNGTHHASGAYISTEYQQASDDFRKVILGQAPHPENLKYSWPTKLSKLCKLSLVCDAKATTTPLLMLSEALNTVERFDSLIYFVVLGFPNINYNYSKINFMLTELISLLTSKKIPFYFFNETGTFPTEIQFKSKFLNRYELSDQTKTQKHILNKMGFTYNKFNCYGKEAQEAWANYVFNKLTEIEY